ncbi:T9SS type A sorting domain-containing protein [Lewinella sp. LCG006]|uniref:T9SS type A sorting domain-containing protein n=1 Tax=Lewinella sp. LCG006 TaxID=3231911 RepID=UPI0034611E16
MNTKLLLFFLLAFSTLANAQVAFEQNVVIDSTYGVINPRACAVADIDNDGFKDLLIAGYSDVVWVRSIDGMGGFAKVSPISTEFIDAGKVAAADFDGDNDVDVVILARSDNNSYEVLYAENTDGLGSFAEPVALANTAALIFLNLQVLDMDNDGDMDIAYSSNDNISWLENTDGQASFTDHYLLGDNQGFYAVDVDGDNISDIIADFGDDLRAYKLNPDGTLSFLETMNTFSLNQDFKAGDLDDDGDNDVVTLFENGLTRQIHWYENIDGLGTFSNRQILLSLPSISGSTNNDQKGLEIIDIDNDNLVDVVVFESRSGGMSWYKNLGSAVFGPEQIVTDQIPTLSSITISDLDNDGAPDILFTDYALNEYSWFKNQDGLGDFGSRLRISSYAYFINHVDYGDIDGDGDLDLVSSSHADNKVAWYENTNGLGDFSNIQQLISTTTDGARDVFAVDLDGDLDQDVLVSASLDASTNEYQLLWFENDGTGTFTTEHIFETTMEDILRINYADVDNDGDMDVICGQENSVLALYKNNGDGTFAPPVVFSETGFAYLTSLEVADLDGDGDIDVLASYISDEIIWHENVDGLGDLSVKHIIIEDMPSATAISVADLDGDDDNDVLFASRSSSDVGYFLNEDGLGTFGPKVITSEIPQNPNAIYSMDVDGDGDMDMVAHSSEGQRFIWFPNDGSASFGDPVEISSLIKRISHITSADIDGDGKTDLITSSYDDDQVAWFRNLGTLFNNTISGVVRLDANADGCDAADAIIPNVLIQTENNNNTFATFTQPDGSYSLQANQEIFTTAISSALPTYYTSNPASHTFDFIGLSNTTSDADFCVEANQTVNDLGIVVYPDQDEPRPGFETTYRLIYKNNGTTPLTGTIDFQFDGAKLNFLNASETIAAQTTNSLTFNYTDLIPFETRSIDLAFEVFPPPTTSIDDVLNATATITPLAGDANEADNSFNLVQTVIGAYDPNDIRVLEGEEITIEEAEKYLHYIIRFQNTGTASAINIRVNNVLDDKFDWSTLQLEDLSHPGRVEITDGNIVNFLFNNINLPDSTTNEPASHGFIAYKIKPRNDVVVGDIFSSTADIYFDFNPPITTNTATTEIVNPSSVTDFEHQRIKLFPNPASSRLTIAAETPINLLRIYDLSGRVQKMLIPNGETVNIDVSDLVKGLYFVEVKSVDGIEMLKFIKL